MTTEAPSMFDHSSVVLGAVHACKCCNQGPSGHNLSRRRCSDKNLDVAPSLPSQPWRGPPSAFLKRSSFSCRDAQRSSILIWQQW